MQSVSRRLDKKTVLHVKRWVAEDVKFTHEDAKIKTISIVKQVTVRSRFNPRQ